MRQSKVIGVTGGVGAGKSTLLSYVQDQKGYTVILADEVGRHLTEKGKCVYKAVVKEYGAEILDEKGNVDRKKLYEAAFTGENADVGRLNAITHPLIKREIRRRITVDPSEIIFVEAALLYEGGLNELCQEVWYVSSSKDVRKERLLKDREYSYERSENIMSSQMSEEEFLEKNPVLIENKGSLEDFYREIDTALAALGGTDVS